MAAVVCVDKLDLWKNSGTPQLPSLLSNANLFSKKQLLEIINGMWHILRYLTQGINCSKPMSR